jgi:hypothetical protein
MENELGLPVELNKKELKLLKRSLPSMLEEHRRIQRKFRPRKNSGVRGMPKCTHNRLRRLEAMIEHKGELIAKAIEEENALAVEEQKKHIEQTVHRVGDSYRIKIPSVPPVLTLNDQAEQK